MVSTMYVFMILAMSFLLSILINKQRSLVLNIDALRRFEVLQMKNSNQYDPQIGAINLSFFPISLIAAPFMIPLAML